MDLLNLVATPKTPTVVFDPTRGILRLEGKSIPENSVEFYRPLLEWLDQFRLHLPAKVTFELRLEYFNTSSSKCLLDVFRKLEGFQEKSEVLIEWYYDEEDEDMREVGEDYQAILSIPIALKTLGE